MKGAGLFWVVWVVLFVSLGLVWCAHAEHTDLTQALSGYKGKLNQACCGELDCVEATVSLLNLNEAANQATVQIGEHEVTLPAHWVHPSPKPQGYWCFVVQSTLYYDPSGHARAVVPEVPTQENSRCVFYSGNW